MNATLTPESELTQVARDPSQFRVEPPADVAFFEGSRAAIVTDNSRVDVHWVGERPIATGGRAEGISSNVLDRLRKTVERNPASAVAHANLGLMLLSHGEPKLAEPHLKRALSLDPRNYGALMGSARLALASGNLTLAAECYSSVLQHLPEDAGAIIGLSQVAREEGNLEEAIALLRRVSERDARAASAQYEIGMLFLKQGRSREAIGHFKEAVRHDVRSPRFHHALGVAYALVGELNRAKRSFQTTLTLAPRSKDTVLALAKVFIKLGELESATELLRDEIGTADDYETREALAASLLDAGKYAAAKAQLTRLAGRLGTHDSDHVKKARILNNLGVALVRLGEEPFKAEQLYTEAIRSAPSMSPIPYRNLAGLHLNAWNMAAARDVLAQCVALFPKDSESRWVYSSVLAEIGDTQQALDNARLYCDLYGDSPEVLCILAAILADDVRDLESALRIMERARVLFPANPRVANNLAYIYLLTGDAKRAREVIEGEVEQPIEKATWTATRGLLEIIEGRIERGAELYEEAIATAFQESNRRLALIIRQKMFLELARAKARAGHVAEAKRLAERGLAIERGKRSFRSALDEIVRRG